MNVNLAFGKDYEKLFQEVVKKIINPSTLDGYRKMYCHLNTNNNEFTYTTSSNGFKKGDKSGIDGCAQGVTQTQSPSGDCSKPLIRKDSSFKKDYRKQKPHQDLSPSFAFGKTSFVNFGNSRYQISHIKNSDQNDKVNNKSINNLSDRISEDHEEGQEEIEFSNLDNLDPNNFSISNIVFPVLHSQNKNKGITNKNFVNTTKITGTVFDNEDDKRNEVINEKIVHDKNHHRYFKSLYSEKFVNNVNRKNSYRDREEGIQFLVGGGKRKNSRLAAKSLEMVKTKRVNDGSLVNKAEGSNEKKIIGVSVGVGGGVYGEDEKTLKEKISSFYSEQMQERRDKRFSSPVQNHKSMNFTDGFPSVLKASAKETKIRRKNFYRITRHPQEYGQSQQHSNKHRMQQKTSLRKQVSGEQQVLVMDRRRSKLMSYQNPEAQSMAMGNHHNNLLRKITLRRESLNNRSNEKFDFNRLREQQQMEKHLILRNGADRLKSRKMHNEQQKERIQAWKGEFVEFNAFNGDLAKMMGFGSSNSGSGGQEDANSRYNENMRTEMMEYGIDEHLKKMNSTNNK